ncbi:MAG: aldo/keto reductase [Egibacteraceae bacterium]
MGWSTADDKASLQGLLRAFELGATLFDTADVYGRGRSERPLGRFLREVPRDQVVIASKVGYLAGTAPNASTARAASAASVGADPRPPRHRLSGHLLPAQLRFRA